MCPIDSEPDIHRVVCIADGIKIPQERVFFTFASGRFTYNCVSCNAQCCRGHGYRVHEGAELEAQLALTPAVAFFFRPVKDGPDRATAFHVSNCKPGCFFLDEDGRCDIQKHHGYRAKPETCRLFPFNNIRFIGGFLIVAPHTGLCPLSVVAPSDNSAMSAHTPLLEELCIGGVKTPVADESRVREGDVNRLIVLERRIVDLSEHHLADSDYTPFAAAQLDAYRWSCGEEQDVRRDSREEIRRHLESVLVVLGKDAAELEQDLSEVSRPLVASTPFIRSQLCFPPPGTPGYLLIPAELVPHFMLGLFVLLVLARQAGLRTITFQTITRIFQSEAPLLALLAHASQRVRWHRQAGIVAPTEASENDLRRFVSIAKTLLAQPRDGKPAEFGTLVAKVIDTEGVDRFTCLRRLSGSLLAGISPGGGLVRRRSDLATLVRQFAWRHLGDRIIVAAIRRQRASAARAQPARP